MSFGLRTLTCDAGPTPDHVVVGVHQVERKRLEEVIVDRSLVDGQGFLRVSIISIGTEGVLVELPAESVQGRWRIRVRDEDLRT